MRCRRFHLPRARCGARLAPALAGAALLALGGCQARTALTPAPSSEPVAGLGHAATAELQNVSIVVQSESWRGDPEIEAYVTPLRVEIENHSDMPLRVRYSDFALANDADGARYAALPPYSIEGSVSTPVTARAAPGFGFAYSRFHVAPHYRGFYPDIPRYGRAFHYDPFYYDHYFTYWAEMPLPTEEMLRRVIPEGVIDPGGKLSGFLYFERVPPELDRVEFRYELASANDGRRFGMISIPFLVRED